MFHQKPYDAVLHRRFLGHTDGLWEITNGNLNENIIGTASADGSARIWDATTGSCLAVYREHTGSVNSIRFHPSDPLACTASGDGSIHIWLASFQGQGLLRSDSDAGGEPVESSSPATEGDLTASLMSSLPHSSASSRQRAKAHGACGRSVCGRVVERAGPDRVRVVGPHSPPVGRSAGRPRADLHRPRRRGYKHGMRRASVCLVVAGCDFPAVGSSPGRAQRHDDHRPHR